MSVPTLRTKLRRDLLRRKGQVGAVLVTIVLGVALFGASFDAYANLEASYRQTYDRLAFADLTITGGNTAAIDAASSGTAGVAATATRSQADLPVQVGDHRLFGRVVGMPADGQPAVDRIDVTEGSSLDPARPDGVVAEQHLAEHFGLHPGSQVEVLTTSGWRTLEVVGVAVSPEYLWPARSRQEVLTTPDDFGVLFVPEALAAEAPSALRQVLVRYDGTVDAAGLDSTLTSIAFADGATDVLTQADQPSNAALQEDVSGFGELSFLFPVLFLGAAGMATFLLLTRLVASQRAQIGTLRANGLGRRAVLRHYLAYGLITGVLGAAVGVLLGGVLGRLITGTYTSALSIPDTVVSFHPATPVVGLGFGVVAGLLAAWVPARSALKVSPAEAMRGDVPTGDGHRSLLERILPPVRHLPVRWRMALRGIGRSRRRSISTVLGVVLALVVVLASWGMVDTTQVLVDQQFNVVERQSAQVFLATPLTDATVADVGTTPGVATAEPVSQLPVAVASGGHTYGTQLTAFEPDTTMHTFVAPDGSTLPPPSHGVYLGAAAQDTVGVAVGDDVTLSFPTLGTSITARVDGFVSEPLGTLAYLARPELAAQLAGASPAAPAGALDAPGVASIMVRDDPGADPSAVRDALAARPDVAVVVDARALYDAAQGLLGFFYAFVGVMLVFGGIMAFALVFNMMSVNIAERTVELATMRANGFGLGSIARLLTGESVLLTCIGIAVGLPVGVWVSAQFLSSFSSDLFQFDLQVRTSTLVISGLAMLVVTLLSEVPGIRSIGRLDLGRVVRERSQ